MKIRLCEKFTSEIFSRRKYPDLRYYNILAIHTPLDLPEVVASEEFKSSVVSVSLQWTPQIGVTYNVSTVPVVNVDVIERAGTNLSLMYDTVYNVTVTAMPLCGQNNQATSLLLYYYRKYDW